MKSVLITGAGGFIGYHLVVDQLRRGREVTAIDLNTERLQPLANNPHLHIVTADFSDLDRVDILLPGHDVCFHLAGAHLETNVSADYFWQVNVVNTEHFAKRCHLAGISRFIHCSSVGVYGDVTNPPADEESACYPDIPYEKTKLAGEQAVLKYALDRGYEVVVVRPSWVYGPYCHRTSKLFRSIKKGRFFYVGDGKTLRHPIYIDDMIDAFEIVGDHKHASCQVFVIAGPSAVTLRSLVDEIARCIGVSSPVIKFPKWLVLPGVYLLEMVGTTFHRDVPFTRRSLKFFMGNTAFNTTKAQDQLDFYPQVELNEGVCRVFHWMKEHQQL